MSCAVMRGTMSFELTKGIVVLSRLVPSSTFHATSRVSRNVSNIIVFESIIFSLLPQCLGYIFTFQFSGLHEYGKSEL